MKLRIFAMDEGGKLKSYTAEFKTLEAATLHHGNVGRLPITWEEGDVGVFTDPYQRLLHVVELVCSGRFLTYDRWEALDTLKLYCEEQGWDWGIVCGGVAAVDQPAPALPAEVWNETPFDPVTAWEATQALAKGV